MGERNLKEQIVFIADLIEMRRFNSIEDVYNTPDSILPRVRRNGKIIRPLRFYLSDVDRLFSKPGETIGLDRIRSLKTEDRQKTEIARPSILFKRRRK